MNQTREELIRLIVIQFGEGKTQPIAYYQERLTSIASRSSVRDEIKILDSAGIIILTEAVDDKRVRLVVPAQRLIDWYCEKLPTMITKIMAALTAFGVLIE